MTEIRDILRSAQTICEVPNVYYELDTIERVIVPELRLLFGETFDDVDTQRLVRGNNIRKGNNQKPDLSVNMCERNLLAIECKSVNVNFECHESLAKSQGRWTPVTRSELKNKYRCSKALYGDNKKAKSLATYLGITRNSDEFKFYRNLWTRFKLDMNNWTDFNDEEKARLTKLVAYESNPTEDLLGQLWRYSCDGKHEFDRNATKLIWTNGLRWVIFKPIFYSCQMWPNVPVASDGKMVSCKYFDIVDLIEDVEKKDEGLFQKRMKVLASCLNGQHNEELLTNENTQHPLQPQILR